MDKLTRTQVRELYEADVHNAGHRYWTAVHEAKAAHKEALREAAAANTRRLMSIVVEESK